MMLFRYDDELFSPPAPILQVTVSRVSRIQAEENRFALLDTGADMTAIPVTLVHRLRLTRVGKLQIEDVNGNAVIKQTYAARLQILGHELPWLEIVLTELDFVVLGRDVLNLLDIRLNGPGLMLTVLDQSQLQP